MSDCESETFDCESETSNVSDCETNNDLHSDTKYNPCIRKGKRKAKYVKKLKKYEAKAQKMNLIRSKNHKVIDSDFNAIVYTEHTLNELLEILKTSDIYNWNDDYEYLYEKVYYLNRIDKYKTQYEIIQHSIELEKYDKYEDDQYEYYKWVIRDLYRYDR